MSLVGESLKALSLKLYPLDSKFIWSKATYLKLGIEVSLVGESQKALFKKLYPLNSKLTWWLMQCTLSSWCPVMVERLFLTVPQGCLRFVIVVFPDHTHLLFLGSKCL